MHARTYDREADSPKRSSSVLLVAGDGQGVEFQAVVNALITMFASFNPFIFGAAFCAGVIILVRTPERLLRVASGLNRLPAARSLKRRNT